LIYTTFAGYVLAFAAGLFRFKKLSGVVYFIGFLSALVCVGYRWYCVGHVPMQNLFEVFVVLGALIYPVSIFSQRFLPVGLPTGDKLIAVMMVIPAAFVFSTEAQQLPPALQSWFFAPHVGTYILGYVFMAKGCLQAVSALSMKSSERAVLYEEGAYRMVCGGFVFLTAGLVLGSVWAQRAWGDYWGWDPKEMWSLATWLVYAGYFHFRYLYGKKWIRINGFWVIWGMIMVLVTLLWVNFSRFFSGLHIYAS